MRLIQSEKKDYLNQGWFINRDENLKKSRFKKTISQLAWRGKNRFVQQIMKVKC